MNRKIEGVPRVIQRPFWCGYACLSMVMQYWGYDITQEQLFDHIYGPVDGERKFSMEAAMGIGNLAVGVEDLTSLRADLWGEERFERIQHSYPNLSPHRVLQTYLAKGIPCIVRIPHHYNVATGFDTDKSTYTFNETNGQEIDRSSSAFENLWAHADPTMPYDTRHLILAVHP